MSEIVAIGAGRMGRGIAQVYASAGHPVTVIDFKQRSDSDATELHQAAATEIATNLDFLLQLELIDQAGKDKILGRIHFAGFDESREILADARFIFEGVPETLGAKQDALQRLSELAPPEAIIASTTSTILVDSLAEFVVHPERFLNAHWLNPAYLIPLVEVSPGTRTSPETLAAMMQNLRDLGKSPVKCKASPGYIIPRIQSVAMNEAARMIEEGVATAEDIDTAIRTGFGIRYATMGLVEFIDWGGLDILYYASNYLSEALGSDRYRPPKIVDQMMQDGHLGLSAGRGFYDFTGANADEFRQEKLKTFTGLLRHLDLLPKVVTD